MRERRKEIRVEGGILRADVAVPQPAHVLQISSHGMLVETTCPLVIGSLHDFRLTLETRALIVKGRVAHSRISDVNRDGVTYLSGIELVELPEHAADAIAEFVEAMQPRASPGRRDEATGEG